MINQLSIKNFKSIKNLSIPCKKLNVLIGEPNSGKSNIIEALALQSQNALGMFTRIFRFKTVGDFFYDFNINKPVEIDTGNKSILKYAIDEKGNPLNRFHFFLNYKEEKEKPTNIAHDGRIDHPYSPGLDHIRLYEFSRLTHFINAYMPNLNVPSGDNLPSLLLSNPNYKKWISEILQSKGLKLTLKPNENEILASKLVEDEIYSYPYFSVSETLQRIIFYSLAIMSNKGCTLLFDEPDCNTFPVYTKQLAEMIALEKNNQYFITTHNPYLLLSLIEKSKSNEINVCIVKMKDYQTKVFVLNEDQVSEIFDLDIDVFFNLDKILKQ